jgi:hypothetical protein
MHSILRLSNRSLICISVCDCIRSFDIPSSRRMCKISDIPARFLNYQTIYFSGKDTASGIWGWSLVIYAYATGQFDSTNLAHQVALWFALVAMPFGCCGNFIAVLKKLNDTRHNALLLQIMSFLSVFMMIGPGWAVFAECTWSDPLCRYVVMVTMIDTILEPLVFGTATVLLFADKYTWPIDAPLSNNGGIAASNLVAVTRIGTKISHECLNYETIALCGSAQQTALWGLCELAYCIQSSHFEPNYPQIMGIVLMALSVGKSFWNAFVLLSGKNNDGNRDASHMNFSMFNCSALLIITGLSLEASLLGSYGGWDLSDALVFFMVITTCGLLLELFIYCATLVSLQNNRFAWPNPSV